MQLRTLHAYVGMFIAPTVLFMAVTGLLQVYSLHEDHPPYYEAPVVLETLGRIHKDQTIAGKHHDEDHDADAGPPAKAHDAPPPKDADKGHQEEKKATFAVALLKLFFAIVSIGLVFSTSIGIWMAWKQALRRKQHMILLAAGTAIPLILALLTG
jgi:hypothetical protein